MTRNFRNFLWFLFGAVLAAVPLLSMAETIPATNLFWARVYKIVSGNIVYGPTIRVSNSDGAYKLACEAAGSYIQSNTCMDGWSQWLNGWEFHCPTGQNWTFDATYKTCTRPDCAPGETRGANGQCVPPLDYKTCAELVVTSVGSCVKSVPCGDASTVPLDVALTNAAVCSDEKPDNEKCPPGGIVIGEFRGKPICISPPPDDPTCKALGGTVTGTINGQPVCSQANNGTCPDGSQAIGTANGQPVCSGNCPSGTAPGTVNGVESCYPISKTTDKTTTQKGGSSPDKTTTTTTDNGDGTSTTTTTTTSSATTCSGDRCTTTTTTSGEGGDSTKQTEQDKGDFCRENPKAAVCKGETEEEKFCKENPQALSCVKLDTPAAADPIKTESRGIAQIVPGTSASGSCPSNVALPHGAEFDYAPMCDFATSIRPLVLGLGWLIGGMMIFAWFKS